MTKFLVTYHGGSRPTPEQMPAMTAAFGEWMAAHAAVIVDGGAPCMPAGQVATGAAEPLMAIGGYSILEGPEDDVRVALAAHPSSPAVARSSSTSRSTRRSSRIRPERRTLQAPSG